jgi:hypothetical protein
MPRFYCDYCDAYLTHDSMTGRQQHMRGTYGFNLHCRTFNCLSLFYLTFKNILILLYYIILYYIILYYIILYYIILYFSDFL